jgi:hypothetical protein
LKPGRVYSSLSVHVANDLVVIEAADDIKIRPLLLIMSFVIARTQALNAWYFQRLVNYSSNTAIWQG